jgi:hypothetical protein
MFWDYSPLEHDAWWHYYHNPNYAIWQRNVDKIFEKMRECAARGTLSPRLVTYMRVRAAAQKQRDADAAEEKQRAEMPVLHVNDVWDDGGHYDFAPEMMQWDDAGHYDAFMLDI